VPDHPVESVGGLGMGNGLVSVVVDADDGTFSIDGLGGFGRLVDGGDAGDTYNWCPPVPDLLVDQPESVQVQVLEQGRLRGRIVIDAEYQLPAAVEERLDGTQHRMGRIRQPVRTTIELRADEPFVRVETTFANHARDHRLRVHLPLPRRCDRSVAECAFALVERPLYAEGGPNEWGVPTYPSRRFVQAGALTVTHEGLCEYELIDLDGAATDAGTTAGTLALTLVRSTGWLSRGPMPSRPLPAGPENRLEGAQVQKELTLRYAVARDAHSPVDPYELAERVWSPLAVVNAPGGGDLSTSGTHLTVNGAEVDAVLTDPDGSLVVRVHEAEGHAGVLEIPGRGGHVVDLRGRVIGPFEERAELRPHQILTVRLRDT
jgi:mannosylglycerate hydrolase